jgi:aldose 1-epimerase
MSTSLHLRSGALRCDIRPDLGGCLAGLWHGDQPVLRSTPGEALTTVRQAGSYPLVPYSNRLAQARLVWNGTSHPLVRNNAAEPHAIHGVGWQRPWEVLEAGPQFALLSYEHRPDAAWPFAFDTSQAFQLRDTELELTLSITNQSTQAAPVGLGWHPYFVKHADSHLRFAARGRWEMGEDKLPTGRRPSTGLDADCAALDVDHCFDGWDGEALLSGGGLRVRLTSGLERLVVFTHPGRDTVAVEPVSHVNNAANLLGQEGMTAEALGLTVLLPGASLSATMTIGVEAV